jgi:predicted nucleic acid-binding protein
MIVIADSTPLNYLILIHQADLLPQLFDRILIPPAVFQELQHQETPDVVRDWIASPPSWLQVQVLRSNLDPALAFLDPGEREAIALAEELQADQLLLDDADARREPLGAICPSSGHSESCARRLVVNSSICESCWCSCRRRAFLSIPR